MKFEKNNNRVLIFSENYKYAIEFNRDENGNLLTTATIDAFIERQLIRSEQDLVDSLTPQMIERLHEEYDMFFENYLSKYPKGERESFPTKQAEAIAWRNNNNAPTPTITAMACGDSTKRQSLIDGILAKVDYIALQEGNMIFKREQIKACTTIEELEELGLINDN